MDSCSVSSNSFLNIIFYFEFDVDINLIVMNRTFILLLILFIVSSCASQKQDFSKALKSITTSDIEHFKIYHRPADNYDPEKWALEGIAEDAGFAFTIGYELATFDHFPEWNSGSEFKHLRNR